VALLRRYEKMRYTENLKMMTIMDVFYQAFSNKIGPIKILRNIGLSIPEKISPLKNIIMRHAMGLEGHLPKLAQRKY
jgi:2-octaprenyl-3-methyl-6-methoxy-1,4-benzoquinol hydroxylase